MKLLLILLLLLAFAILGSRRIFIRTTAYLGLNHLFATGIEYVFVGLLLGPVLFDAVDAAMIHALAPFISFGLGWIGLLFGMQFNVKTLARLPHRYFSISVISSAVTFLVVSALSYFFLKRVTGLAGAPLAVGTVIFGITASCTAPSALALADKLLPAKPAELLKLLRYISSIDGVTGIIVFGIAASAFNAGIPVGSPLLAAALWTGISILAGLFLGYLFHFLISSRVSDQELLLIIIGTVTLTSGMALYCDLSPLFINFLMGVIITNSPWSNYRVSSILVSTEKAVYILLLLIIGARWDPQWPGVIAGLFYTLFRLAGKTTGAFLSTRLFRPKFGVPALAGLTLSAQGGLSLAILLSFSQVYADPWADFLVSAVITAVILSIAVSPGLILTVLKKPESKP